MEKYCRLKENLVDRYGSIIKKKKDTDKKQTCPHSAFV
jgi:hypothetical protein